MVVPPSRVIEKTRMLTTRITKGRASNRRAMYLCKLQTSFGECTWSPVVIVGLTAPPNGLTVRR